MTDVDGARAALTDELNILAGVYHVGRGQLEAVRAAADRLAMAWGGAYARARYCEAVGGGKCVHQGGDRVCRKALRARLEGGRPC